mmetsp:Transcript_33940/g.101280  ORF Transcript_33940/g.101280 Transcript_33940/m.101280 type:complete len:237 (-) Transcript_33940:3277-3987(-)
MCRPRNPVAPVSSTVHSEDSGILLLDIWSHCIVSIDAACLNNSFSNKSRSLKYFLNSPLISSLSIPTESSLTVPSQEVDDSFEWPRYLVSSAVLGRTLSFPLLSCCATLSSACAPFCFATSIIHEAKYNALLLLKSKCGTDEMSCQRWASVCLITLESFDQRSESTPRAASGVVSSDVISLSPQRTLQRPTDSSNATARFSAMPSSPLTLIRGSAYVFPLSMLAIWEATSHRLRTR